jgi:hypothetical protein
MLKCFKFVMDNPFHIRKAYRYVLRLQFSYGYIFLSRKLDYSIEILVFCFWVLLKTQVYSLAFKVFKRSQSSDNLDTIMNIFSIQLPTKFSTKHVLQQQK